MKPAYLITWKPLSENKKKGWPEESLVRLFNDLLLTGDAEESWRFARHAGVKPGQSVYLLRQGRRGHALLGFGQITEAPRPGAKTAMIQFRGLVNPKSGKVFATQEELHQVRGSENVWNTQASGVLLPTPDGHPNSPTHGHLKLLHLN